jgi:hypothetical protein
VQEDVRQEFGSIDYPELNDMEERTTNMERPTDPALTLSGSSGHCALITMGVYKVVRLRTNVTLHQTLARTSKPSRKPAIATP